MTNAERQQRWRDLHRPRKRKAVHVPLDILALMAQHTPPGFVGPHPTLSQPTPPPVADPPAPAPEHNFCPHCGAATRKRAKSPKLAA